MIFLGSMKIFCPPLIPFPSNFHARSRDSKLGPPKSQQNSPTATAAAAAAEASTTAEAAVGTRYPTATEAEAEAAAATAAEALSEAEADFGPTRDGRVNPSP